MGKKKSVQWIHNGIVYTISLSDKPDKKLMADYETKSGKKKRLYFGSSAHEHFKDATGLLPKHLNHNDPERRRLFRARFRNQYNDEPNSLTLSWHLLW